MEYRRAIEAWPTLAELSAGHVRPSRCERRRLSFSQPSILARATAIASSRDPSKGPSRGWGVGDSKQPRSIDCGRGAQERENQHPCGSLNETLPRLKPCSKASCRSARTRAIALAESHHWVMQNQNAPARHPLGELFRKR